jgi:hypothetical protein
MKLILISLFLILGMINGLGSSNVLSAPLTNKQTQHQQEPEDFIEWIQDNLNPELLDKLRDVDPEKLKDWVSAHSHTEEELAALQLQKATIEDKINQRKYELGEIQKKLNLLKLTPAELAKVEEYNKSFKQEFTLLDWIVDHRFDIALAALFFGLGMLWDKYNEKKKHRKKLKAATN